LLSSLYQKLYETTQDKKYKQESIRYSKKSQSWLENNSMDSTMERFHSRMLETESTRQRDHSTRAVLLCVNARNIFEMSELSESEFKNFKLTSSSPLNSGDVVFLCSKSRHGQKEWRLTAAAKITGEANWIPANSYEHSAQGLCRPSYSPTLTLNFDPSILVENSPIELSGDALDYIVDSVREQIDQEEISQDFSQTLTLLSA
jgi:hypothetical protein